MVVSHESQQLKKLRQGAHLSSRVKIQSGQHRQATALEKIILVGVWTCLYYGPALPACCTELCTKPRTSCIHKKCSATKQYLQSLSSFSSIEIIKWVFRILAKETDSILTLGQKSWSERPYLELYHYVI